MTTKEEILALAVECGAQVSLRSGFGDCRVVQLLSIGDLEAFYHAVRRPLEEEIERLKTVPMKYRRMAFNAQLQDENNELRQQLALYAAENSGLRAAGFENGQDLLTSYQGLEQQLAACQAREQQLWDAFQTYIDEHDWMAMTRTTGWQ